MAGIHIGSRKRKSPFHESTLAAGASLFTIYNRMYMPTGYGDAQAEYMRLTRGVAVWDVAAERQVEIAGPNATDLVQYLSARDLSDMKVGRARYAPLCDHLGRLINDPVALRVGYDRYWFSLADSEILLWARAIAGERGDDVEVFEPDVSPLAIQGPLAADLAKDLFGAELIEGLGFFHHCPTQLDGIPMVLCRSGWSKQGGFELFLTDSAQGNRLWDLVMQAGEKYGIGPGSPDHQERIESGLLSYGSDHDHDTDPIEAGLGAYVSLDGESDFVGKAAIIERLKRTERRPIVNVRLEGNFIECNHPWSATVEGRLVGQVRNAVWSSRLNAWIGLAQLTAPHSAPGAVVDVDIDRALGVTATVTEDPFGAIRAS